jgi:two-component system response regulator BaeR
MNSPHTPNAQSTRILVVEDDIKIAAILNDYFVDAGYQTHCLIDGHQAVAHVRSHPVDLIILDLMLPGLDGIEVCRTVRTFSEVPIIMLTARVDEIDRLIGLESGADDYVCKPFSPREVVARAKAQLRRYRPALQSDNVTLFSVNADTLQVAIRGLPLALTPAEFRLLSELVRHPGRVYSRQKLLDFLHDDQRDSGDRTIDSHVKNIRKKLAERLPEVDCLQSVYGVGYRFELPE